MDAQEAFEETTIPERRAKPRQVGLTMLIDWGLGPADQADWLEIGAEYIDLAKIAVGISRLLPADLLRRKIALYEEHQVIPLPGGQFLEYAVYHGQTRAYLAAARAAGYRWIEVSDNVIELTPQEKSDLIRIAHEEFRLQVLGEVGSKVEGTSSADLIADIQRCLDAGAWKVFVEAAELFGADLNEALIEEIAAAVSLDKLIFEVPGPWIPGVRRCDQHATRAWLIRRFGPQVNLANVPPKDVLEVETTGCGIGVAALKWSGETMSRNAVIPSYGQVTIRPADDVIAGSYGTWTVTITVGRHGIDDGGRVLIARRLASNWGIPQFERPGDAEYTTVHTSGQARLRAHYDHKVFIRPWKAALVIDVYDGALAAGDTLTVTFGDTRFGSPGSRAQTFRQERYEFRVLVDAFGTGQFVMVPDPPALRIIGGPAVRLRVRAPSEIVAGQPFPVTVVAEDRFGNPADGYQATVQLTVEAEDANLPQPYTFQLAERGAHRFEGLTLPDPGIYRLVARETNGQLEAVSNPIVCHQAAPPLHLFWGDIHGQTEASVGTGSVDEYFAFGRYVAALDFISHCANDFQITREHWQETKDVVRRYHQPGRYVTFLACEWSGNTPEGGDHNVYYRGDDGPLHGSSHWQIADRSDAEDDRYPISELHETLRGRNDVMIVPHIGGRHANLDFFDPAHSPLIEIASVHGVFEWFAEEALRRGLRVGFIANSDDHTGRPGATYPSGSDVHFGMRGGLLAVYADTLTREALWKAFWARRCYGTTGERIILRVNADGHPMGAEFAAAQPPSIKVEVIGTAPLETVELRRGTRVIYTYPLVESQPDERRLLKLVWEGARVKWRERPTCWDGSLSLDRGRILSVEPFAFDSPNEGITSQTEREVRWRSTTAGDPDGLFLDLDTPDEAVLTFQSEPATFAFRLSDLAAGPLTVGARGIGQQVIVSHVPRGPRPTAARFTYRDESAPLGTNAYWLRVIQRDGAMAWSSPIYVELTP